MLEKALALAKTGRLKEAEAAFGQLLAAKKVTPAILKEAVLFHLRYSLNYRQALQLVTALVKTRPNQTSSHTKP